MKKILIEIGHPAHVHQFKNMYWELEKKGWKGLFVAKDKECAIDLLKAYNLPHVVLGLTQKGITSKIASLPYFAVKMLKVAMSFKPDIFVSRVSPLSGWSSFIMRKPHITCTDTENVRLLDFISEPFADVILTSESYLRNHGKKQLRYPGTHELAYLHPKRFTPDRSVYNELGISEDERFALIRFISWNAHHDIGQGGFSIDNKLLLVEKLSKHLHVFISSESPLPEKLARYQVKIPPEKMHSLLNFATLFIGEGSTMAEESSVLGTPSILLTSCPRGGVIFDLERYGLLNFFSSTEEDQTTAINLALEYATSVEQKDICSQRKQKLLSEFIDVSLFLAWFVEKYPSSFKNAKKVGVDFQLFR